jgi:OCT family organic cation transporter-like MFS transporter 4/5
VIRIGGVLCPYVNMLSDFWTPLPLIIYGGLATAGGLLALLLPETLGTGGCSYNCRFVRV